MNLFTGTEVEFKLSKGGEICRGKISEVLPGRYMIKIRRDSVLRYRAKSKYISVGKEFVRPESVEQAKLQAGNYIQRLKERWA